MVAPEKFDSDGNSRINWELENGDHPYDCGELCEHCVYEIAIKFQETLEANHC